MDKDEDFIGYCDLHSRTERALFHVDHVQRMLKLAGRPPLKEGLAMREWWAVHDDVMLPLCKEARRRLTGQLDLFLDSTNPG